MMMSKSWGGPTLGGGSGMEWQRVHKKSHINETVGQGPQEGYRQEGAVRVENSDLQPLQGLHCAPIVWSPSWFHWMWVGGEVI